MNNHTPSPLNKSTNIPLDHHNLKEIALAGGCFWGVEAFMARVPGVAEAISGYVNGNTQNPSYEDVCRRGTGHAEAVLVRYDPAIVSLDRLLRYFIRIIDPTTLNRQGSDVGRQYRSGIYYTDDGDKAIADAVLADVQTKYKKPVVTEVQPLENFAQAEEYHQDYLEKNPSGYCHVDFSILDEMKREGEQI